MIFIGPISSIFDYATFCLMLYFYKCHFFKVEGDMYERLFQTGWFVESILTQTMIVHIIRTRRIPFFQSSASPLLLFTTAVIMAIGVTCRTRPSPLISASCPCRPASGLSWSLLHSPLLRADPFREGLVLQ